MTHECRFVNQNFNRYSNVALKKEFESLNPFDITIVVIIAFCLIRGAFRGIIKEASSIIGVIAGLYAGIIYYPHVSSLLARLDGLFQNPAYINITASLIIFCAVFAGISAIGILLKYLLKVVFLSWVDKICGACFGFVKGYMIVAGILFIFTAFLDKGSPLLKESVLSPYVSTASETVSRFASKDLRHEFSSKFDVAKKAWSGKK